jgi:hypothetical protein
MDSFLMIFDTFGDQQNGFVFGTNAAGVQYDAQVRNQGDEEDSWDGSWDVRTSITATSWTAEFHYARFAMGRRRRRGGSTSFATSNVRASAATGRHCRASTSWGG